MFSSLKLFHNLVSKQAERRIRVIAKRGEREKHMAPMMLLSDEKIPPEIMECTKRKLKYNLLVHNNGLILLKKNPRNSSARCCMASAFWPTN